MTPLVTTDWLEAHLRDDDLRVLDARFYMPAEAIDPEAAFAEGHIPGAQFFNIEKIADDETDLPHMVPSAGRFARCLCALGVSTRDRVVFYDQKGVFSAPRGWWMMRLFGHENCAVLDGGLAKWRSEGKPLQTGPAPTPPPGQFVPDLRAARLRGIGDMLDNLATGRACVLDARAAGRFTGAEPEPRPGLPSGHIPGSLNLPWSELLAPDQTLLPPERLRARFAQAGIDGSRPVITTCGSGVSASLLSFAMVVAGLPEAAIYDGSWTEWALRADTPKIRTP
jgi:thiosulfate/3-mercaptopyruvate sulfurtransferase